MGNVSSLVALAFACLVSGGCQSKHSGGPIFSGYESPYPKGSAVAISPALELPAIRSLKGILQKQYGDDRFDIIARRSAGPVNRLIIDSRGRLWKGDIHEVWTVEVFGRAIEYELMMKPTGKGEALIEFKKYEN